jgi:hypothetical protein
MMELQRVLALLPFSFARLPHTSVTLCAGSHLKHPLLLLLHVQRLLSGAALLVLELLAWRCALQT